jgi:CheY-like chemotaxis protein
MTVAAESILFVDDEPHLLQGIARACRSHFAIQTATGGAEALQLLCSRGPFAVVVSDMRMPEMNGVEFLAKVRERSPQTVRMVLTGQADLSQTIAAVNEGNIFRFLSKPCSTEALLTAVTTAIEQYRLVKAEKELLEHTLSGAVHMLLEILGVVAPPALARARRLQRHVIALAQALQLQPNWQWPLAALLSQIGCVSLPKDTASKVEAAQALTEEEQQLFASHPQMAAKMLEAIPRFESIAAIVASQSASMSEGETFGDLRSCDAQLIGKILLRAAIEFDRETSSGRSAAAAARALAARPQVLPNSVLAALTTLPNADAQYTKQCIRLQDLAPGMIFDEPLLTHKGLCLVPADHEVTVHLLARLRGMDCSIPVREPFRVRIPH